MPAPPAHWLGPSEPAGEDELRDSMVGYAVRHSLQPLAGPLLGEVGGIELGQARLAYVRYGAPTRVVAEPTNDRICWTLPAGPMEVELGRARSTLGEGFLLDATGPTVMLPCPSAGAVVLTVHASALRNHLTRLLGTEAPRISLAPGPSTAASKGQVDLAWRYVVGALRLMPNPPPGLLASLGESLLTALLMELPDASRLLAADARPPSAQHARRAAEWAAANYAKPVQVTRWAEAVALSVRHLQATMQAEFGCTPTEYLLQLRLEHAHALILRSGGRKSVTTVATDCGFTHLGRFAAAFKARYGVGPRELLRSVCRAASDQAGPVTSTK